MPYATATLSTTTLASTTSPISISTDIFFPPSSINWSLLTPTRPNYSPRARSLFTITVGDTTLEAAAWSPPVAEQRYEKVRGWIAFEGVAPVMIKYKKNFVFAARDAATQPPTPASASYTPSLASLPPLSPPSPNTSPPTSPSSTPATPTDLTAGGMWDLSSVGHALHELSHSHTNNNTSKPVRPPLQPLKLGSCARSAIGGFGRRGSGLESVPEVVGDGEEEEGDVF